MENKQDKTTVYGYYTIKYKEFRKELQRLSKELSDVKDLDNLEEFALNTNGMMESRTAYVCVCLERPPRNSDSTDFRASFSFCAPEDWKRFSRPKARQIANSRMKSNHFTRFEFKRDENTKLPHIFKAALDSLWSGFDMIPDWYERAVDTGEIQFGIYDTVGKGKRSL